MIIVLLVLAQLFVGMKMQQATSLRDKSIWFGVALTVFVGATVLQFFLLYDRPACQ